MDKFSRMLKNLPSFYRAEANTVVRGLLKSWGLSDDQIEVQLKNTKDQLFVETAEGRNLDRLGSNVGVDRAPELGLDSNDFRKLIPVLSFYPKQVRKTIIDLLDVFWGPNFTRPNINSGNTETFNFGPATLEGGTANFRQGEKLVKGSGTNFLSTIQPGDYIKPSSADGKSYQKVSAVIDDETLQLSLAWKGNVSISSPISIGVTRNLSYRVDGREETTIRFIPNAFSDLSAVTINELVTYINSQQEHSQNITASTFQDPISGSKLNIRTNTPGLQGSIKITGGDANDPSRLNFNLDTEIETRAKVIEVNPNEIVVQIPSSVPVLRRYLKGSAHPRDVKATISSDNEVFDFSGLGANSTLNITIDGTPSVVTFVHSDFKDPSAVTSEEVVQQINSQLTFLKASTSCVPANSKAVNLTTTEGSSEYQVTGGTANSILNFTTDLQQDPDLIQSDFPSAYIFDPNGQLFTVTQVNASLAAPITAGTVQSSIVLDDASSFPNTPGSLLFDFGRSNQEGPINYNSRPNNSTLLIDASYTFQENHAVGRKVNLIKNTPSIPRLTGEDYPVYITGTEQARTVAQDLIKQLLASGVVIRFIIDFPEVLFECICRDCGPSDDPDLRGSRTADDPLDF